MTRKSRLTRTLSTVLPAAALLLVGSIAGPPAHAQTELQVEESAPVDFEAIETDRRAKASRYELGKRVPRYLSAAQKELEADRPDEAEALLLRLDPKRMNPLQRASIYRFLAYVAYSKGDTLAAIGYFEKVLAEEIFKLRDETKIRLNIAQLSAQVEDWKGVVRWIDSYVRYSKEPDPLAYYLKSLAHYQLQELDAAIQSILIALEIAREPREGWLRLLAAMYSQKEDYESAAPAFEELLLRFPKKVYWAQLSLIYGALEDYPRSLAVQQIAYAQGFVVEDKELQRLARAYLFHDLPYRAARVLSEGIESGAIAADSDVYEMLANSWIAAREYERALPPLQQAAELAEDGNLYVRLGQVLMQRESWEDAAAMLEKALAKGGLENTGNAVLLTGIAYYNGNRISNARGYFVRARKYQETRAEANNWITHIEREQS